LRPLPEAGTPRLHACAPQGVIVSSKTVLSLRNLLVAHAPLLLVDAASARVQVGLLAADAPFRWEAALDDAGTGLFRCVEALEVDLTAMRSFAFCEGPGSILGIRTTAIAVRMWRMMQPRPCFAYTSLAVIAHGLGRPEVSIIADGRRDSWHQFSLGAGLRRVPASELSGELVMPEGFRNWSPLPSNVTGVPYSLAEWFPRIMDATIFHEVEAPDAFLHEEPSYVNWTPQVHRAPTKT